MKRKFTFDSYSFDLLKFNKWFAVYVASEGAKILFYQLFHIVDNRLIINRFNRCKELDGVKQLYEKLTKKYDK